MPSSEILSWVELMRRRLRFRCAGLLEVAIPPSNRKFDASSLKVKYLHRTAKDFLHSQPMWSKLVSCTPNSFIPYVVLAGTYLLSLKIMTLVPDSLRDFWILPKTCLSYSLHFQESAKSSHIALVNELERTGNILFESLLSKGESWPQTCLCATQEIHHTAVRGVPHWTSTEAVVKKGRPCVRQSFFEYAFQYLLHSYVQHKLEEEGYPVESSVAGRSLLSTAVYAKVHAKMVKILLEHGADPNNCDKNESLSPWDYVLQHAATTEETYEKLNTMADTVNLFLEHGAKRRPGSAVVSIIKRKFHK